jgi:Ca2+-binding EF-hand superfamily protein
MNYNNRNETLEEEGEEINSQQDQPQNEENYVYEICQLFDKDNDETIYMKDLLDLIKALGIGLNEETKPIINDFIEKSNEEKIPFEDFLNLYDLLNQYKKSKEEEEQELLKAFEFFDGEGSGFIDVNYFKKAITCFGDKISEEDFNNLIQQVIMDNTNKKFDYKDLAQIILGMKK